MSESRYYLLCWKKSKVCYDCYICYESKCYSVA
nr:MAG TPA: hypothetical protein [Caudoviricetes sp.]